MYTPPRPNVGEFTAVCKVSKSWQIVFLCEVKGSTRVKVTLMTFPVSARLSAKMVRSIVADD